MWFTQIVTACLLAGATVGFADEAAPRPLPDNKPCAYPAAAQKVFVAGPVHFVAQVRPDGSTESVEIAQVPRPGLGFEETVRSCILAGRFDEAPAGQSALRRYESQIHYHLNHEEEKAIRALIEQLAASWNAGDRKAVEDLALRPDDSNAIRRDRIRPLREQLERGRWRMELAPDFGYIRFVGANVAGVGQPYRRVPLSGKAPEPAMLDAAVAKGSRGWRFMSLSPAEGPNLGALHVGGRVLAAPRKIKDFPARYPDQSMSNRIGGTVVLEINIDAEGKVTGARVVRGILKPLDDAAMEAVRQWRYAPTLLDGKAIPVTTTVSVLISPPF